MADMGLGERVVVGGVVSVLCGLIVAALLWFPRVNAIGTELERFDRSDYDDGDVSGGLPVPSRSGRLWSGACPPGDAPT